MKIPKPIFDKILLEANKNAVFHWYNGWESTSGYIKSVLSTRTAYGDCRIYMKWEKKKEPTKEQIEKEIELHILSLLDNKQHSSDQRDFRHYLLDTFFVDVARLKHEAIMSVEENLSFLISLIEKSDAFTDCKIQSLHNDLKNLECGVNDHAALEKFLDAGKKRIGES